MEREKKKDENEDDEEGEGEKRQKIVKKNKKTSHGLSAYKTATKKMHEDLS